MDTAGIIDNQWVFIIQSEIDGPFADTIIYSVKPFFNLYRMPRTVRCKSHKHNLLQILPIKIVISSAVQAANLRMNICNFGSIYSVICVFFFFYLALCNRKLCYIGINKLNTRRTAALFKCIHLIHTLRLTSTLKK